MELKEIRRRLQKKKKKPCVRKDGEGSLDRSVYYLYM